jgi:hypothetical protein
MKRELIDAWIGNLRSGEYVQCKGRLRAYDTSTIDDKKGGGYCCLGVLIETEGVDKPERGEDDCGIESWTYDGRFDEPSPKTLERIGLPTHLVGFFVDLNDDKELSFREIADIIEKSVEYETVDMDTFDMIEFAASGELVDE